MCECIAHGFTLWWNALFCCGVCDHAFCQAPIPLWTRHWAIDCVPGRVQLCPACAGATVSTSHVMVRRARAAHQRWDAADFFRLYPVGEQPEGAALGAASARALWLQRALRVLYGRPGMAGRAARHGAAWAAAWLLLGAAAAAAGRGGATSPSSSLSPPPCCCRCCGTRRPP